MSDRRNVLVVGSGGREHAMVWKLLQSSRVAKIFVTLGNGGTADMEGVINLTINETDHESILKLCKEQDISLVVIGPEIPLVDGLSDTLVAAKILVFGPSKLAAQIEGSKAFSKDLMKKYKIPTAEFEVFKDYTSAKTYVDSLRYQVVIKASGLAAGKGVLIPDTPLELDAALKEMFVDKAFGSACDEVVIEERMFGEEASLLAFCDGKTVIPMVAAQDHKRALDGDQGLNTGGMGAYAPAPVVTPGLLKAIVRDILQPTVDAMIAEGIPFIGCLYAGLMITKNGPRVIEYNCRFGDPETQVVLPLLDTDFLLVLEACASGKLHEIEVKWKDAKCVSVVAASGGYPKSYPKGIKINGLNEAKLDSNSIVFHAGTKKDTAGNIVTSGGRVLNITHLSSSFEEAIEGCYKTVNKISFEGMFFRKDIAQRSLPKNRPLRIGVMGSTRGTDLQAIFDAIADKSLYATVDLVISNKKDAYILQRSKDAGCNTVFHSGLNKSREQFDGEVSQLFVDAGVDLILLIGYMRILSAGFVNRWWGKLLNVHPSLLPKFGGGMDINVHQAVLDAKETESGCTVHFVTHEVDAGPIAVQYSCPVDASVDTADTLKARVQELEGKALIQAAKDFQSGKLRGKQSLC